MIIGGFQPLAFQTDYQTGGPGYTPTPGYIVYWTAGQNPQFFPLKTPEESLILAFDFEAALDNGVLLVGTPIVTISILSGADPGPSLAVNGVVQLDPTGTLVYVPIMGGLEGVGYLVDVEITTTEGQTILDLAGGLMVSAWRYSQYPGSRC